MTDRQPTNAGRVQLVPVAGQTNIYDMSMADGATEQGTALNKANLLKDATAALYGLPNTAVPNDVLALLPPMINDKAKIETGSYVGTGVFGSANPNTLTFEKPPKLVHIYYGGSTTSGTESWYMVADFDPNIVYGTRTHPVNENGGTREQKVQWSNGGKTLSWYNTQSAAYQMNAANVKFYYYVIY